MDKSLFQTAASETPLVDFLHYYPLTLSSGDQREFRALVNEILGKKDEKQRDKEQKLEDFLNQEIKQRFPKGEKDDKCKFLLNDGLLCRWNELEGIPKGIESRVPCRSYCHHKWKDDCFLGQVYLKYMHDMITGIWPQRLGILLTLPEEKATSKGFFSETLQWFDAFGVWSSPIRLEVLDRKTNRVNFVFLYDQRSKTTSFQIRSYEGLLQRLGLEELFQENGTITNKKEGKFVVTEFKRFENFYEACQLAIRKQCTKGQLDYQLWFSAGSEFTKVKPELKKLYMMTAENLPSLPVVMHRSMMTYPMVQPFDAVMFLQKYFHGTSNFTEFAKALLNLYMAPKYDYFHISDIIAPPPVIAPPISGTGGVAGYFLSRSIDLKRLLTRGV